ncbi:Hpt domain-containing protein [Porticoccaceae bacterium LTM1]|nr:Hpt domain-containing protein [Porticoccaceae bacterium LTM1]
MNLDLGPAIESFLEEATDFVAQLESDIMALESAPQDQELINSIFRAAHTIKGSGGMFGFDGLVAFTHVFESVLMRMRDGQLVANKEMAEILLAGVDHIGQVLSYIDLDGEHTPEDICEAGEQLGMMLAMYLDEPAGCSATPEQDKSQDQSGQKGSTPAVATQSDCPNWLLSLRFGENVLRDGMDPSSFLRYLQRLGDIVTLNTLSSSLPALEEMDPEQNYLGFEIQLQSESSREELLDVFEFVQEQSLILLVEPKASLSDYRKQLHKLPESVEQIVDLWCESGVLTPEQARWCQSDAELPAESGNVQSLGIESGIALEKTDTGLCLAIAEPMNIYNAEQLTNQLNQTLTSYPEAVDAIQLDLTGVSELDTTGMQILVSLEKTLSATGQGITGVLHSETSRGLFDLYRIQLNAAAQ